MWHTLFGLLFDLSDSFSSLLLKSVPWTPLQVFSSPRKKSPGPPPVRGPCNWSLVSFPFSLCILPSPCCLFTSFFPYSGTQRGRMFPPCLALATGLTWCFTVLVMRENFGEGVKACTGKMLPCAIKCGFTRFFF